MLIGFLPFFPMRSASAAGDSLPPPAYDLIEQFGDAVALTETNRIEFGAPAARPLLDEGWAVGENRPTSPFRWGIGDHSTVRLFLGQPRALTLSFRCSPFRFANAPPQHVTVSVNGRRVDEVTLMPGPRRYTVHLPTDALILGENRLVFSYAYSQAPAALNNRSRDIRPLAVAWEWLQIDEVQQSRAPFVDREAMPPALVLPAGTQVDYYLDLAPGSFLVAERLQSFGASARGHAPHLEILFQSANSGPSTSHTFAPPAPGRRIVLPVPGGSQGVERVSLRSIAERATRSADAGLKLIGLAIRAPAPRGDSRAEPGEGAAGPQGRRKYPNIIVYLIDTLRADHLGCYGYHKPTSPHIDAFAQDATLFTAATAQSSWTRSAVASIFTGLIPARHGVQGGSDALSIEALTLAELMEQAGYETAAFSTNANIIPKLGFSQGFHTFEYLPQNAHTLEIFQYSDKLNTHAFDWLTYRARGRPFLLYLHATDPHAPYSPPSPYREQFAAGIDARRGVINHRSSEHLTAADRDDLTALYDGDVASNDAGFGNLIEKLKALGLYDTSLIVLIADHGEEFYDHRGWLHGHTLYMEQLHIPLIIHFPDGWGAGQRVNTRVQQIDLVPTLLAYLGRDAPPLVQGRSLIPLLTSDTSVGDSRPVLSSRVLNAQPMDAVIDEHMKLIRHSDQSNLGVELYDLDRDPSEQHNLAKEQPELVARLTAALVAAPGDGAVRLPATKAALDDKSKERLRAIGYGD